MNIINYAVYAANVIVKDYRLAYESEIWKNRRYSAVEIEGAAYYSLRQIWAARILLFAVADMVMDHRYG